LYLQVYQNSTGKFKCRNKYYGRQLGVEGFREGLIEFLHNGNRLRTDALIPLVEKLLELKAVLQSLDTFRFYTSSLLLIYEGLDPELCGDNEPGLDDALSSGRKTMDVDTHPLSPTNTNTTTHFPKLSKSIDNFLRAKSQEDPTSPLGEKSLLKLTSTSTDGLSGSAGMAAQSARGSLGSRGSTPSTSSLSAESVDVRLIDFAHATHSGLDMGHSAKPHAGADAGFIFGLSNLIKELQEIVNANS